jgi:hypothetical protein
MENDDDPKFRELLRESRVPGVPKSLDERVLALRKPRWTFLLTRSIRVPIPVGLVILTVMLLMGGALLEQRPVAPPVAPSVNLLDFRPASDLNVRVIRQNGSR